MASRNGGVVRGYPWLIVVAVGSLKRCRVTSDNLIDVEFYIGELLLSPAAGGIANSSVLDVVWIIGLILLTVRGADRSLSSGIANGVFIRAILFTVRISAMQILKFFLRKQRVVVVRL